MSDDAVSASMGMALGFEKVVDLVLALEPNKSSLNHNAVIQILLSRVLKLREMPPTAFITLRVT